MRVNSSAIAKVRYNPFFVTVTFNHGGSYRYKRVPFRTFWEVLRSESVGRAYHSLIKGKFESAKC